MADYTVVIPNGESPDIAGDYTYDSDVNGEACYKNANNYYLMWVTGLASPADILNGWCLTSSTTVNDANAFTVVYYAQGLAGGGSDVYGSYGPAHPPLVETAVIENNTFVPYAIWL